MKATKSDNKKCPKCKGRSALISGSFIWQVDQEPYRNGVIEDAPRTHGDDYYSANVCDKCGHIHNFNKE